MALDAANDPGQVQGQGEELLSQIRDLLDQYLALGADTPVAPQAQQLASAIDQSSGDTSGDPSGGPMDGDTMSPDMSDEPDPSQADGPMRGTAKTFGDANKSALPALQKLNKKRAKSY